MNVRSLLRKSCAFLLALFALANVVAGFHAYKFTHFGPAEGSRTGDEASLSWKDKIIALSTGVSLPRPQNSRPPGVPFRTISLQSNKRIECWWMPVENSKGTVVLCHGYGGSKASMLDKAAVFQQMRYSTLIPDFMGTGGSEGSLTTIGYREAEQVKTCIDYLKAHGEKNIILFGVSMGAAAIMKAAAEDALPIQALILECPFGTMLKTVQNRFRMLGVPAFPMANLLVFWGGAENGFNAFAHNPEQYAKSIEYPTLLIYGAQDKKVSPEETAGIYRNLAGPKRLLTLSNAGHENYLLHYRKEWTSAVDSFLNPSP